MLSIPQTTFRQGAGKFAAAGLRGRALCSRFALVSRATLDSDQSNGNNPMGAESPEARDAFQALAGGRNDAF